MRYGPLAGRRAVRYTTREKLPPGRGYAMKRAIVIGASEGIGRALARELSREGYALGLAARGVQRLRELQRELPGESRVAHLDVTRPGEARAALDGLIRDLGGADLIVISAGVIFQDPDPWQEGRTVAVNVAGFSAVFRHAFDYFSARGSGHIVGLSSVAAVRGGCGSPVYNASKAFVSNLMHGYRIRAGKAGSRILITDIRPGHVSTRMLVGQRGVFWAVPVEAAARQIAEAIRKKRRRAYITPRWRLVAWAMRLVPDRLYSRFES